MASIHILPGTMAWSYNKREQLKTVVQINWQWFKLMQQSGSFFWHIQPLLNKNMGPETKDIQIKNAIWTNEKIICTFS